MRDLNRKVRRQALLDAALLLFLDRGVANVSVDEITQAAGVAKGSFYRYFDTQEALVEALMEAPHQLMKETLSKVSSALEQAFSRDDHFRAYTLIGETLATFILEHPGPTRLYLQECRAPAVEARRPIARLADTIAHYALEIARKAQQHGILKPLPVRVVATSVVGAAEHLMLGVLRDQPLGNPLEIPDALVTLVLDGLKA